MPVYLDTSALAKWYLNESRSTEFSNWIQDQQDTHISSLTILEFRCLLARRKRSGDFPTELEQQLFAAFQADIQAGHLIVHATNDDNATGAVTLLERVAPTALRTLDAMHLHVAMEIGATLLATADKTMANAAGQLGLQVVSFAPAAQ